MNIREIFKWLQRIIFNGSILNLFIELLLGYIVIYLIGYLCLIPGKNKIQTIVNKKEYQERKIEINKARRWLYIGWTIIVLIINLYILFKQKELHI